MIKRANTSDQKYDHRKIATLIINSIIKIESDYQMITISNI